MKILKIYLAGPQVFLPDPLQHFTEIRKLCAKKGIDALVPWDALLETPEEIYRLNIDLLRNCDGLVADVSPFRGSEPDSGTCWELGFAQALGKPTVIYTGETSSEGERQLRYFRQIGCRVNEHARLLPDGMMKNTQGRQVNLMLNGATNCTFVSSLELALDDVRLLIEQAK